MTRKRSPFIRDPLDDAALLHRTAQAYAAWQRAAPARGKPTVPFRLHLARHDRAVLSALQTDPRRIAALPREAQRALRPPRGQHLGSVTLAKYAGALTAQYLTSRDGGTFEDFIGRVCWQYATETELRTFLGMAE